MSAVSPLSLEARRRAVVAALRAVRDEPAECAVREEPVPAYPDDVVELRAELRRLAERLERVESKVELSRAADEPPLSWPAAVNDDAPLEVPPFEVSRRPSPAFDVLLGPPS